MTSVVVIDAIRYLHLLAVAIGLGAAFFADLSVLRHLRRPVTQDLLELLAACHRVVWAGLIGMWITGIALIYVRTGFDMSAFTPKLFNKLIVVTVLTCVALAMGRIAMPMLAQHLGERPLVLPLVSKLKGGVLVAISGASWLMALAMGESKVLAASGWEVFRILVPQAYGGAVVAAILVVLAHHVGTQMGRRRRAA